MKSLQMNCARYVLAARDTNWSNSFMYRLHWRLSSTTALLHIIIIIIIIIIFIIIIFIIIIKPPDVSREGFKFYPWTETLSKRENDGLQWTSWLLAVKVLWEETTFPRSTAMDSDSCWNRYAVSFGSAVMLVVRFPISSTSLIT